MPLIWSTKSGAKKNGPKNTYAARQLQAPCPCRRPIPNPSPSPHPKAKTFCRAADNGKRPLRWQGKWRAKCCTYSRHLGAFINSGLECSTNLSWISFLANRRTSLILKCPHIFQNHPPPPCLVIEVQMRKVFICRHSWEISPDICYVRRLTLKSAPSSLDRTPRVTGLLMAQLTSQQAIRPAPLAQTKKMANSWLSLGLRLGCTGCLAGGWDVGCGK